MGATAATDFTNRAEIESNISDNGTVTLAWAKSHNTEIELQQASEESFSSVITRYRGTDEASVITGLSEGIHFFRVREISDDKWSKPLKITVEFFPESRLFVILGLGGVVVISTIGTIIFGHFSHRREAGREV